MVCSLRAAMGFASTVNYWSEQLTVISSQFCAHQCFLIYQTLWIFNLFLFILFERIWRLSCTTSERKREEGTLFKKNSFLFFDTEPVCSLWQVLRLSFKMGLGEGKDKPDS